MAKEKLKPRFTPDKNNVLVTDDHDAYNRVLYGTGAKHEVVNAKQHKRGKYNLATVNSVHSALDSYMDSHRGRVFNTKYLDLSKTCMTTFRTRSIWWFLLQSLEKRMAREEQEIEELEEILEECRRRIRKR